MSERSITSPSGWRRLPRWLGGRRQPVGEAVIIVGIGVPAWELHQRLQQATAPAYRTIAFIDENPWNHRTLVAGVTVYYPAEIESISRRHDAALILFTEPELFQQHEPELRKALGSTRPRILLLDSATATSAFLEVV